MNDKYLSLKPITMNFAGSGSVVGNDPFWEAKRTFSQNLIYACKDTAKSAKTLSEELHVPMLYVEEELNIQLCGQNGTYGTLRKQDEKYISNVVIIDESVRAEGAGLYEKYTDVFCTALGKYMEENKQMFLDYPLLNYPNGIQGILWTLINDAAWRFIEETVKIMDKTYFSDVEDAVKSSGRKYSFGIVARNPNDPVSSYTYGCDQNEAKEFCGYSRVRFRNIYGPRIASHFRCGYNLSQNEVVSLLLKAVGGIPVDSLSDTQKEVAAKGIESGLMRKDGNILLPNVLIAEADKATGLCSLLDGFYSQLSPYCEALASDAARHIRKHIQKHLINEYKTYNMLIASSFLDKVIDKCIDTGLLNEPKKPKGPEGVLITVE